MTTKHNTPTRSATNAHEGQTVADNNQTQKFEVFMILAQRSTGRITISAANFEDARKKAGQLDLGDIENWEVFADEMTIESVEPTSEGQDND